MNLPRTDDPKSSKYGQAEKMAAVLSQLHSNNSTVLRPTCTKHYHGRKNLALHVCFVTAGLAKEKSSSLLVSSL